MVRKLSSLAVACVAALALLVLSARPAVAEFAGPLPDDVTVTSGEYTLASGEVIDGDLVVLGGTVVIEDGAQVSGDVVALGGSTTISGEVSGAVALIGGSLELTETAVVAGDVTRTGGSFERAAGADVGGTVTDAPGLTNWLPALPGVVIDGAVPEDPPVRPFGLVFEFVFNLFQSLLWIAAVTALALVVTAFWPDQTARVAATIRLEPWRAFGLGFLTSLAMPVLMGLFVLLALTLCLIPVSAVGALGVGVLYGMAWLFGWIALGQLVGLRLAEALNVQNVNTVVATTLGTLGVSVLAHLVGAVPFVGGLVAWFVLPLIGIGAVALTRFGARPYVQGAPPAPPASEALEPPPMA